MDFIRVGCPVDLAKAVRYGIKSAIRHRWGESAAIYLSSGFERKDVRCRPQV